MWVPGLMFCGSAIQPARFPLLLASVPAAIVLRLPKCVRSGPTWPDAVVPSNGVTENAGAVEKYFLPSLVRGFGTGPRQVRADGIPEFKLAGRLRNHPERHVGVLKAAKLGALAAKSSGTVGLKPFGGDARRDEIPLPLQIRDPEAMNDVVRIAADHDRTADGNMHFVGGDENAAWIVDSCSGRTTTIGWP